MTPTAATHPLEECYQALGFSRSPFGITPDTSLFFPNSQHITVYNNLRFTMHGGGIAVLTGEVGLGKTLICRYLLRNAQSNVRAALIVNPLLSYPAILATIYRDVTGRHAPRDATLSSVYESLVSYAIQRAQAGEHLVVLVDEAHKLSTEALEGLRQLTNIESERRKLFSLILVGQPELDKVLALRAMRPLRDRILAWCRLSPLSRAQCTSYIQHRISKTQQVGALRFSWSALLHVFIYSRGVPRRINLICDRSLLHAYAVERTVITGAMIRRAANDLTGNGSNSIVENALRKLSIDHAHFAQQQQAETDGSKQKLSAPTNQHEQPEHAPDYIFNKAAPARQKRPLRVLLVGVLAVVPLSLASFAWLDENAQHSVRRELQAQLPFTAEPLDALLGPLPVQLTKTAAPSDRTAQVVHAAAPTVPPNGRSADANSVAIEPLVLETPIRAEALATPKQAAIGSERVRTTKTDKGDKPASSRTPVAPPPGIAAPREIKLAKIEPVATSKSGKTVAKAEARTTAAPAKAPAASAPAATTAPPNAATIVKAAGATANAASASGSVAAQVKATPQRSEPAGEQKNEQVRTAQGSVASSAAAILRRFAEVEALTAQGKFEAALTAVILVEGEVGETWQTRYLKGLADKGLRRWEDAIAAFTRAHQLNPGSVKVLMGRAIAQQEMGNHEAALLDLQLSRALVPALPDIALNSGYSLEALGRKEDAQREYNRFLEMTSKRQGYDRMRDWVAKRVMQ